jgi:hypothetical protein
MNEKFTPAPWIYQDGDNFEKDTVITTESRIDSCIVPICEMDVYFDGDLGAEQEANAALIAAAPEMYNLLMQMHKAGRLGLDVHKRIEKLLAKARGEV